MATPAVVPSVIISAGTCGPGTPAVQTGYTSLSATSVAIEGVTTLNPALAAYTVTAAFNPDYISWINSTVCTKGATAFTFTTTGAMNDLQYLLNQGIVAQTGVSLTTSSTSGTSTASTGKPTAKPTGTGTNTPSNTPSQPNGLGGGAVAGVAIGCLIAGALIGALIFFLCGRVRRRNTASGEKGVVANANHSGLAPYNTGGKGVGVSTMQLHMDTAAAIVENNTKDPVSDTDLKAEFSRINSKIDGHVRSFFALAAGQAEQVDHQAVAAAVVRLPGGGVGLTEEQVVALLESPKGRPGVLRAIIARILVSRMGFEASSDVSLLPPGVASTLHTMPYITPTDSVKMAFLTKWRVITGQLLNGQGANANPAIDGNVRRAVEDVDAVVGQYAPADNAARLENLEEITRRCARVASVLFTQPAFWKFDWAHAGDGLVVFPALLRLTDENGRPYAEGLVLEEKQVVT